MTLCGISSRFQLLSPTERQVAHALLTRPPLSLSLAGPTPFDLHVLGTPPAFVLSQDQTLKINGILKPCSSKIILRFCSPANTQEIRWLFSQSYLTSRTTSLKIVQGAF